MTRVELQKELKKLEGCIEILHTLITKPLCDCIPHLGSFNESFREENREHLEDLMKVKNSLIPLTHATDDTLQAIEYEPIKCY